MTPREEPFWDYSDLALFAGALVPALAVAWLMARGVRLIPGASRLFAALSMQLFWYVLIFVALAAVFKLRYRRPFWGSLGWKVPFRGEILCLVGGPFLAITVGVIGYLIHTPMIKLPQFDDMFHDRATTILLALFVVAIGPLCEELAFRGFLMPLLMRTLGVAGGIAATALVFGGLHAAEYQWSWRHVVLISTVGGVLGWVRYATGSTAGSMFLHATYNLTQLAAFFAQPR